MTFTAFAFVVAAAAGALLRWRADGLDPGLGGAAAGLLAANVAGSFALGLLAGVSTAVATVVGTGFLGALTSVSGLAHRVAVLSAERGPMAAYGYLAVSAAAGIAAAGLGLALS